jgi:hypothetical protein
MALGLGVGSAEEDALAGFAPRFISLSRTSFVSTPSAVTCKLRVYARLIMASPILRSSGLANILLMNDRSMLIESSLRSRSDRGQRSRVEIGDHRRWHSATVPELVAAESRDNPAVANRLPQPLGDDPQHLVAKAVTKEIIDLEAIKINQY